MFLIETILGALTGYGTNDIAIRQLFSKNGVVVRERAQFTDLLVRVLQEEIFNDEVIASLREQDEVADFFARFVHTLITEELPYALSDRSLADYDEDGKIRALVQAHMDVAYFDGMALNAPYVHQALSAALAKNEMHACFQRALADAAKLTPNALGAQRALDEVLAPFEAMTKDEWSAWVDEKCQVVAQNFAAACQMADTSQTVALKEILPFDGAFFVRAVESLVSSMYKNQDDALLAFVKDEAMQDGLFTLAQRVLPEIVGLHLSSVVEALSPMLLRDREEIEQMLIESIAECGGEEGGIFGAISGIVQQFMAPKEDGDNWLEALLKKAQTSPGDAALCEKVSNKLLAWVVGRIDTWRNLDSHDEEGVARLHAHYNRLRALCIRAIDAYLDKAVITRSQCLYLGEKAFFMDANWAKDNYNGAALSQKLRQLSAKVLETPLGETLLTEEVREEVYGSLQSWWQSQGVVWLEAQHMDDSFIREKTNALVMDLFETPIARLICDNKDALPFDAMAAWMHGWVSDHLSDFLGQMTHKQLDSLDEEEIRQLVLDVLGREMRPLAYLGGGIGAVAGAVTGTAMQISGVTPDSEAVAAVVAARSAMYGAVGYGTNVMAIKGLFWPYEKKFGMQGLICKNQERFANKMKELANDYIINDAIWTAQVQKIAAALSEHYDEALKMAFHYINAQKNYIIRPYIQGALETQFMRKLARTDTMQPLLKRAGTEAVSKQLQPEKLLAMAKKKQWLYKGVCALAMKEAQQQTYSSKLQNELQMASSKRLGRMAQGLMDQAVVAHQGDGAPLWQALQPHYRYLPEFLSARTTQIATALGSMICARLSFPLQFGYKLAGGDALVEQVVKVFVDKKLPSYLFRREEEVAEVFVSWCENSIAGASLAELGINVTPENGAILQELVERIPQGAVHEVLLGGFMKLTAMEAPMRSALEYQFTIAFSPVIALVQTDEAKKLLARAMGALAWPKLTALAQSPIQAGARAVLQNLSFDVLMGLEEGGLWQRVDEMLSFSEDEKQALTAYTFDAWQSVEPAVWAYIASEGRTLLVLLDVPNLVQQRIEGLSPEALEKLVRDMAQPYFTRVERMGWIGAVVAVPATMLSMMLGGF